MRKLFWFVPIVVLGVILICYNDPKMYAGAMIGLLIASCWILISNHR